MLSLTDILWYNLNLIFLMLIDDVFALNSWRVIFNYEFTAESLEKRSLNFLWGWKRLVSSANTIRFNPRNKQILRNFWEILFFGHMVLKIFNLLLLIEETPVLYPKWFYIFFIWPLKNESSFCTNKF